MISELKYALAIGEYIQDIHRLLLEFIDCGDIVCFYQGAVAGRAGQLGTAIRDIVVAWTIGRGSELFEELKVVEDALGNSCQSVSAALFQHQAARCNILRRT